MKMLTVFLMQIMDIVWNFTGEPIVKVDKIGPFRNRRARDSRKRVGKPAVNEALH